MSTHTHQTKRNIQKMKNAGFARKDFSVKTESIRRKHADTGKWVVAEYGDAHIYYRGDKITLDNVELIRNAINAELDVTFIVTENFPSPSRPMFKETVYSSDNGRGSITIVDTRTDKPYPLNYKISWVECVNMIAKSEAK